MNCTHFLTDILSATEKILRRLRPADMDASHRTGCMPGTRTSTTQFVMNWTLDLNDKRNVLWLYGLAGSGKSTLATTVANRLHDQGRLGTFVFFERDNTSRNDPSAVIRTIAYQLGLNQKKLRDAICDVIESQPNTAQFPLESQFRQFIIRTRPHTLLTKMHQFVAQGMKSSTPIVIVIDALDECGTPDQRASLLRVLSELTKEVPALRFLIASRPEPDIRGAFASQAHVLSYELDTSSDDTTHDISTYLYTRLNEIRVKSLGVQDQASWPDARAIQQLAHRASGLFLWATSAVHFIDGYNPQKQLRLILADDSNNGVENALDEIYRTTLESAGEWNNSEFVQDFRSIMGIVLAGLKPLSAGAIDRLRGRGNEQQSCARVISQLGSLITQQPTVRLLHPSFADFLWTRSRCVRGEWFFDQVTPHHELASRCIDRLNSVLKNNICNLNLSLDPVDGSLPEDVEYACVYWVEHICRVTDADSVLLQSIHVLLLRHLLHWLEAMSILKLTRGVIELLERLSAWLSVSLWSYSVIPATLLIWSLCFYQECPPGSSAGKEVYSARRRGSSSVRYLSTPSDISPVVNEVSQLVDDGLRLIRRHTNTIETHPLLTYACAHQEELCEYVDSRDYL